MPNFEQLKNSISDVIKNNGNNEITGNILQNTLLSILTSISENRLYAGIATNSTNPGTPDANVFYIASDSGIYPNFNISLNPYTLAIIINNGNTWVSHEFLNYSVLANGYNGIATIDIVDPLQYGYYISVKGGIFPNFGYININEGFNIIYYNEGWKYEHIDLNPLKPIFDNDFFN